MPSSYDNCDPIFINDLLNIICPNSCFDVGCGYGKSGHIIKTHFPQCQLVGFEIYQKYIEDEKHNLFLHYSQIHNEDFYAWIQNNVDWQVDLVVFGDVLEHFFKSKVYDILDMCRYRTKWIVINVQIDYLQNTYDGNIHEAHVSTITLQELVVSNDIVHYAKIGQICYYLIKGLIV